MRRRGPTKRILDAGFRYRPSFATDIRETSARVRREQGVELREAQAEPGVNIVNLRSKARASSAE